MERRIVKTLIKEDKILRKYGDDNFVVGKISGIAYCICGFKNNDYYISTVESMCDELEGYLYTMKCTADEYDKFINVVENLYPGLCEFNY